MEISKRILISITFIILVFICGVIASADAETAVPTRGKGPYSVGFGTMEFYDHSRTIMSGRDYFGNLLPRETARPIQICIWYPAKEESDNIKMVFGEYNFPYPEDRLFIGFISEVQDREISFLQRLLRGDQGMVLDILNNEVGAVRDAAFIEEQFPLIIQAPDLGNGIPSNFELNEFLASHGFIVVAVHSLGSFQLDPTPSPSDLETLIRDLEFARASLIDHPNIDQNKIGLMGCGFGCCAALLFKMRNYDIGALTCVDFPVPGSETLDVLKNNSYYNTHRVDVPLLIINRGKSSGEEDSLFDSLRFSLRYIYSYGSQSGICLSNYDKFSAIKNNESGQLSKENIESYNSLRLITLNFLNTHLKGEDKSQQYSLAETPEPKKGQDLPILTIIPAAEPPPTENQFMDIIEELGVETAANLYDKFRPDYPDHIFFRESAMNILGYRYLQTGRAEEAVALFRLNADSYPNSANAWDSYGEACLAIGEYRKAIENYKKALEILPNDSNITEQFRNAIANGAPQQIQRIEEMIRQSESEENK